MLAFLRRPLLRPTQPRVLLASARCLSTSVVRLNELDITKEPAEEAASVNAEPPETTTSDDGDLDDIHEDGFTLGRHLHPGYIEWVNGFGKQFRHPFRPKNWLGGSVPFPLNPSFRPPTPVSQKLRSIIWDQFISNPEQNNVRFLAARYGLSIARIDAILRLKGLEEHWIKNKPIQTGFVKGMEEILGVDEASAKIRKAMPEGSEMLGEDATQADIDYDALGNDEARHRYQRLFWEPHPENKSPIVPRILEEAREKMERRKILQEQHKSDPEWLGDKDLPKHIRDQEPKILKDFIVERNGRPSIRFLDVGGKFLDIKDLKRRKQESERRAKVRAKRQVKKQAAIAQAVAAKAAASGEAHVAA